LARFEIDGRKCLEGVARDLPSHRRTNEII
jgi:hypothetical protein